MQHYPTTTIVKALTRIRRERMLPQAGEVAVRVGQEVSPVQVVERASRETGFKIINAARELNLAPADLARYLQVEVGAAVQRGRRCGKLVTHLGIGSGRRVKAHRKRRQSLPSGGEPHVTLMLPKGDEVLLIHLRS